VNHLIRSHFFFFSLWNVCEPESMICYYYKENIYFAFIIILLLLLLLLLFTD